MLIKMGTQLVVTSHNNSSTVIVTQATTAGKEKEFTESHLTCLT